MGQDHIGLVLGPNLHYPSMYERDGIQDIYPLICKHVKLHGDDDMDRSVNCSALSLLLSKLSGSAALVPLGEWLLVSMFISIACAMADVAFSVASETSVWASMA